MQKGWRFTHEASSQSRDMVIVWGVCCLLKYLPMRDTWLQLLQP